MTDVKPRLPAEWEPQAAILVAWPHRGTDWAARLESVEATCSALIAGIARFQTAIILVANDDVRRRAEAVLAPQSIDSARVRFVEVAYDDTWLRDSGPITLIDGSGFTLNDFRFTGWGGKFEASLDDRIVSELIARKLFVDAKHRHIDWALEGGAIESDGKGTILTTWKCLHLRHPDLSREQITSTLLDTLAAERVLWLDYGYLEGDDTDAHIDTLARLAPDDTIVFQACDDPADSHYNELQRMAGELQGLRTVAGKPYTLHALPWPKPITDEGRRLAASYANYLIINGAVLVPAYGDSSDDEAARIIGRAHPGREIVQIPCRSLIWQNGSLHCLTMQLPQGLVRS
ncbi:MAG TPA: agmatine deiminase family protein [Dokdonella sp.]|uniref:agmatine deiminase family protein n=1 Tax=Dokdonella sp. TaxID=2291710 RepID=UPI002D7F4E65|nr:agmatine deiminase family protein [Dokdonella sp.]HET9031701.1 agmatine deiminase family protein [Dokdonella sp.]